MESGALQREVDARRMRLRAIVASTVGTSIEWYDFFLYTTAAALVFPRLFFPTHDPYTGILLSFSTYFVGFAARPVGAAFFGHDGSCAGAVSVTGIKGDLPAWRIDELGRLVRRYADDVSGILGGGPYIDLGLAERAEAERAAAT